MLPSAHLLYRLWICLTMAALAMAPATVQATGALCGNRIQIGDSTYNFAAQGVICNGISPVLHLNITGSPSGLAHAGGNGIFVKLSKPDGTAIDGIAEFWAVGGPYGGTYPDCNTVGLPYPLGDVECFDQVFVDNLPGCGLPYIDISGANGGGITWYPTFGGHGNVGFFVDAINGAYYSAIDDIPMRSTDVDADGDTDEDDENALIASKNSPSPDLATYDLNFDGFVTGADSVILVTEANRRDGSGLPYARAHCTHQTEGPSGPPAYDWNNYHEYPPATIGSLTACYLNSTTLRLSWTCVADDGSTGRAAMAYDIRMSSSPIASDTDFNNATQLTGEPTPGTPGTIQTFDASVSSGQCAYFAMKVVDNQNNWSGLSNSAAGCAVDHVTSLAGVPGTHMVKIGWTAPGCTQSIGVPTTYDLRYSTSVITESNFSSRSTVGTSSPNPAGGTECVQLFGLNSNQTYYFALKFGDGTHWSAISNVPSAKTKNFGEVVVDCGGFRAAPVDDDPPTTLGLRLQRGSIGTAEMRFSITTPPDLVGKAASLKVLDIAGRSIGEWSSNNMQASEVLVPLRTGAAHAGVYYARLVVGEKQLVKSVVLTP